MWLSAKEKWVGIAHLELKPGCLPRRWGLASSIKRFILFHGKRHPLEMGEKDITQFLSALAVESHVSASTQNQALCALLFLSREVLARDVSWLDELVYAKRPKRLPVVLTPQEVKALLSELQGVHWLMATLL